MGRSLSSKIWILLGSLCVGNLSGPIFHKELRVMARQRRYYVLRIAYLLFLLSFMGLVWLQVMPRVHLGGQMAARMARAGKTIVAFIAWFQFIGLQLVAVVIMSNAISEEIYRRTLTTLMTTPITSLQIVVGKLCSKGLQILLLFGVSIPLLALVRVFGGVPWGYLVSSFCITVTMVWFLCSLTLLFSTLFKRAYTVMVFTVMTVAILFGTYPLIATYILAMRGFGFPLRGWREFLYLTMAHTCPYISFAMETQGMLSPRPRVGFFFWPLPCLFMILLSLPLLALACLLVRRASLRHLTVRKTRKEYKIPKTASKTAILYRPLFLHSLIRRFLGTGLVWKEFLTPVLGRFRFVVYIVTILFSALFFLGLIIALLFDRIELIGFLFTLSIICFFILAVLFTVIVPATCITSEKETRCWPILLTTVMSSHRILAGKLVGVLRRVLLAWAPFVIVFGLLAYTLGMPFISAIQLGVIAFISIGFLIAMGLYLSTRYQHTTPAVITNLAVVGLIWAFLPLMASFLHNMRYAWRWIRHSPACQAFIEGTLNMTPPGLILSMLEHVNRGRLLLDYKNPSQVGYALAYVLVYSGAALLLLWRAKANIRRHT